MHISQRSYIFGDIRFDATGAGAAQAPFILAGPQMYAIGRGTATIGSIGEEHLVGQMGGIWAHPLKVADGISVDLLDVRGEPLPVEEARFTEGPGEVSWRWSWSGLGVSRRDRVLPRAPVYASLIQVVNDGLDLIEGMLSITTELRFLGCWFGGLHAAGGTYRLAYATVLGSDDLQTGWGVAFGTAVPPDEFQIEPHAGSTTVNLRYGFKLEPGAARVWTLLLTVGQQGGVSEAEARWLDLIETAPTVFNEYEDDREFLAGLPAVKSADSDLRRDIALAQANLRLLETSYPDHEPYFLAGLPEYPQLFGCDSTYSIPGVVAAGFTRTARSTLETLGRYAKRACGRVPHEITTNGRVFHPGNIQETPQFTIAVWDYLRWTGDLDFAHLAFPICREGMLDLMPMLCGRDGHYPYGDGMVERLGMGSRKLDSACYYIAGLRALANIAEAIGAPGAGEYRTRAAEINVAFERDWWMEDEGLYADSMYSDGRLQLDGHWTAVLPVQLGLAAPERAERVLARIESEFVNQWGLVHTRGREELVWTLPTGLLALTAFANRRAARGLQLTRSIAHTARYGTLGTFKELIPAGLCFIQLWSAALYLQAIFEGLLGLQPNAPAHHLVIAPCIPTDQAPIELRDLRVGAHHLDLTLSPRALQLSHRRGLQPLRVTYAGVEFMVPPGEQIEHNS